MQVMHSRLHFFFSVSGLAVFVAHIPFLWSGQAQLQDFPHMYQLLLFTFLARLGVLFTLWGGIWTRLHCGRIGQKQFYHGLAVLLAGLGTWEIGVAIIVDAFNAAPVGSFGHTFVSNFGMCD